MSQCRDLRGRSARAIFWLDLRELAASYAFWIMLLISSALVGYSFVQATYLYSQVSRSAANSPELGRGLSPLDGILVPTFGALYVVATFLFPFVVIRLLGAAKQSGAIKLLLQTSATVADLVIGKFLVAIVAWLGACIPALCALAIWRALGGHLGAAETLNLLLGHFLYATLISAVALLATAVCSSTATAALVSLAVTVGSWVFEFATAGKNGLWHRLSALSLTSALRPFEQGLFALTAVCAVVLAVISLLAAATIWLTPGVTFAKRLSRSAYTVLALAIFLSGTFELHVYHDASEDRRNSFSAADEQALRQVTKPLLIQVHLAPEDPRYMDLRQSVLSKIERTVPSLTVQVMGSRVGVVGPSNEDTYGEVVYAYEGRSIISRSTSPEEVLPLLFDLVGVPRPAGASADDYPGYPLIVRSNWFQWVFYLFLPLIIAAAWWTWRRQRTSTAKIVKLFGSKSDNNAGGVHVYTDSAL